MSNAALHRESGIPPTRILLKGNRLRFVARINTLDKSQPLRDRASVCPNVGTLKYKKKEKLSRRPEIQISRLQRAYRQLPPKFEAAEELAAHVHFEILGTKAEEVEAHNEWVRTIATSDICAYSDGSSEIHERFSWGYVLQRGGGTFKTGNGILFGGEVYDAELAGAAMALKDAISKRQRGEKMFVFLDNQAAVSALKTSRSASCVKLARDFHILIQKIQAEVRLVPGHSNIGGNEEVDVAARAGLLALPPR